MEKGDKKPKTAARSVKRQSLVGSADVPVAETVLMVEADVGSDDDASTSGSDEEDEDRDVSKKGLARLMEALGDDGLSELDRAHLGLVTGELGEEEMEEEESEGEEEEEDDAEEFEIEEDEDVVESLPVISNGKKSSGKDSLAASLARSGLIEEEEEGEEEEDDEEVEEEDEEEGASLSKSAQPNMYREKINNEDALQRIRDDIALGSGSKKGSLPWVETLVVSYDKSIEEEIGSQETGAADDDLKRELEFYKQALHTATQGRQLAKQANLPFTRPGDYFAEMVKSDEHMERVRQKLLDERAGLKASEEAKKQRELKKFGKKVQVEKQLERTKSRKDMDDKIKGLKRKRKGGLDGEDDDGDTFDVQLESAITDKDSKRARTDSSSSRGRGAAGRGRGGSNSKREAKDAKYGHGGKKRHSKENTRESTNDTSAGVYRENRGSRGGSGGRGGSSRGGRGGSSRGGGGGNRGGARGGATKRPGKARRTGGRS
ncbi:hypothetical protein CBS101457_000762 [Exobasidium rhododendri]|nr:hypothetical protein CBS101457_000762 [Exobasidium rhododendri]